MKSTKTYKFGLFGEFMAVMFMRLKGYSILSRRYKNKLGEIDIICKKGNNLVAVEVKTRGRNFSIGDVIPNIQKKRIVNCMKVFVSKNQKYVSYNIRFDVIAVRFFRIPIHLKNCWEGK